MFPVSFFLPSSYCGFLDRVFAFFARTNTNDFLHWSNENLSVANLSRSCAVGDYFNDLRSFIVWDQNLDLHLRQKIHRILCAPIKLGVSFLAAKPFDLLYHHSLYTRFG